MKNSIKTTATNQISREQVGSSSGKFNARYTTKFKSKKRCSAFGKGVDITAGFGSKVRFCIAKLFEREIRISNWHLNMEVISCRRGYRAVNVIYFRGKQVKLLVSGGKLWMLCLVLGDNSIQ